MANSSNPRLISSQIILAIYYTLADIVLLGQCFYYRGFTFRDPRPDKPTIEPEDGEPNEQSSLLPPNANGHSESAANAADIEYRGRSASSFGERFVTAGEHFSPATPIHPTRKPDSIPKPSQPSSIIKKVVFNFTAVVVVVAAGVVGYFLSPSNGNDGGATEAEQDEILKLDLVGQIFGYGCAVLYL